ncbi:MAG: DUF5615 family PIN-like protein [Pirellulales bacterium]|nr:DUF5615 family PIN-like protein [Pirellulales bacterium]
MRLLADMGISPTVVRALRGEGHDVAYLPDVGLQRLSDRDIFSLPAREDCIVVTVALEFGEIVAASAPTVVSVVLLRLRSMRAQFVMQRLAIVLPDVTEALEAGAVVVVEDTRHRVRKLPIGG